MTKEGATIFPNMGWSFWLGDPEKIYQPYEEELPLGTTEEDDGEAETDGLRRFLGKGDGGGC